eukprot:COSAG01_NODE_67382_length_267_cov_0.619048_1_plen_31_part_10
MTLDRWLDAKQIHVNNSKGPLRVCKACFGHL